MNVKEMFDLNGKVALVTGGGRGIGQIVAEALLEAGAKVAITGRRPEYLQPTEAAFRDKGYDCTTVVADVSRAGDVDRTVNEVLERYGQVDILVNNAGQTWGQNTEDMSLARWEQVLNTNLTGIFLMSQAVGRHMIERKQGRIINIASVAGLRAGATEAVNMLGYSTSKGGVITMTMALAREWGPKGISVNAIAPGWFPTRMASGVIEANREQFEAQAALKRVGNLEELKGVALFLASSASSYITGQTIVVDGGMSL
ncbi:MAG: Gluconate 5-dehydrogenase [Chloroflexi bacterium]|jgi:NAD(P)-dependent dehydrogenase (short-subunit alcohol dehydrogenase family)|nr:Gluconate 5-dehydrogenase [Chloroflexota bacterium]